MKGFIKDLLPPVLMRKLSAWRKKPTYGFSGNYLTWEEAIRASGGYDSDVILEKVRQALLKVKSGEAVYERDSVLFDEVQYSWPILAGLLWVSSINGGRLSLVDFGGSLGSTYHQNLKFLGHIKGLRWNIVEQKKFVKCGKEHFENEHVKFYDSIEDCMAWQSPDLILFSSVLQYLEHPYNILSDVLEKGFKFIIFDRTSMVGSGEDRLTVQRVPPEIYKASYPAWFFSRSKFMDFMQGRYELVARFDALAGVVDLGDDTALDEGFIYRRRDGENG